MITTVVFDLDDTLYDEIDYCRSGFIAVAKFLATQPGLSNQYMATEIFEKLWSQFSVGNRNTTFNAALDKLGIDYDSSFIGALVDVYRRHRPSITLPKDSRDVLEELAADYSLALLSDGFLPAQEFKVRALGIRACFQCIIYTEAIGREFWKPSPKGFQQILSELEVEPQNCVYVGDNCKKDFIAPNDLGFETIQLLRPNRIHTAKPDTLQAAPAHQIETITKLPSLLKRL